MTTTRLRVRLREVEPTVLRVIDVPATSTLPELHLLLQAGLGWWNSHLHEFLTDRVRYGSADDDWLDIGSGGRDPLERRAETDVPMRELGSSFAYHYDLGDGWEHDVEVLGPGAERPGCRYGEGACPPEDCGGPGGHAQLRAALADPAHPEHARLREWAGELAEFDQEATDELVRQTAGAVPESVRLVLDLARDGVKLTPGGRLPRWFVRQVQQQRPGWGWSDKPASREEDLIPLMVLHQMLREVGLLRLTKGVVSPIRAASEDRVVIRRLRSWFAAERFTELLAGLVVATLIRRGPARSDELSQWVFPLLGSGWKIGDQPLDVGELRMQIASLSSPLEGLDLLAGGIGDYRPGPSARTLLPRATALAHLWDTHPRFAPDGALPVP